MEFVKVQHGGNGSAYGILRSGAIRKAAYASRFDCSTAYEPALLAVQQGDLGLAKDLITQAGVFESTELPPDWCYERS